MRARSRFPYRRRLALLSVAGASLAAVLILTNAGPPQRGPAADPAPEPHGGAAHMSPAEMQSRVDEWYASHPPVGGSRSPNATAAVTVSAIGFRFDVDGNALTQVDTARILVGESVNWQYVSGFSHTVTSGTGASDPNVGALFDQPLSSFQPTFSFTFGAPGTVPYFCRIHELSNMRGIVVVEDVTGVIPRPGGAGGLGFTSAPFPNPSRQGFTFHFAMPRAGAARAEVFDARGARLAVVADGELAAGSYSARWDGTVRGAPAPSGAYYVRLTLPGYRESRRVVVTR